MNTNVVVKSDRCFEWSFERKSNIKLRKSPDFFFAKRRWYFQWSELPQDVTSGAGTEHFHENDVFHFKPLLSMIVDQRSNAVRYIEYIITAIVSATSNRNRRTRLRYGIDPTKKTSVRDLCFRPFSHIHTLTFSENQDNITSIKICFHFSDKVIVYSEVSPESGALPKINDPCNNSLLEDMTGLLSDSSLSDLELKCKDGNVKAHKVILCARSKVFAAMLQSNMVESQSGEVKIHDMDTEDLKKFLQYIYTGTLPDLTVDAAVRLYEASDKYAVLGLKRRCAKILAENFSEENACDLLVIADAHSDKDMKQEIICYILNKKIPLKKDIWTDFLKRHSVLAGEVLTKYYYLHNQ